MLRPVGVLVQIGSQRPQCSAVRDAGLQARRGDPRRAGCPDVTLEQHLLAVLDAPLRRCSPRARRGSVSSPIATLATVRPDGGPHVVPVVLTLVGQTIFIAVDHKPKRSPDLQRLVNARHEPRCSVLVDHYDRDWSALWWVRADGHAEVVDHPAAGHPGVHALVGRYQQYATTPPTGALLAITVDRWSGWSSSSWEMRT